MSAKSAEYTRAVRKLINSKLKVQAPPPFLRGEKPRALNQPPPKQASHFDEKYLSDVRYHLFGTLSQETNIKKGNKVLKARTKGHVVGRDAYYGKEYMSVSKGVHNNNYWPGDTTKHRRNQLQDDEDWIPPDSEEINHTSWASLVDLEHYELPEIAWKKTRTPHSDNVPHRNPPKMDEEDLKALESEEAFAAMIEKEEGRLERIEAGEEEPTEQERMYEHLMYTPKIAAMAQDDLIEYKEGEDAEKLRREEDLMSGVGGDSEDGRWRSDGDGDSDGEAKDFSFDQDEFDRLFKEGDDGDDGKDPE